MKLKSILNELSVLIESDRKLGKPLSKQTYRKTITIYRATISTKLTFSERDYVTLSRRFAVEHAENNAAVHDDRYVVISAVVSTENVYDAYNPGEYFYSGTPVSGNVIYWSKGDDFEGWDELSADDFEDGIYDNKVR